MYLYPEDHTHKTYNLEKTPISGDVCSKFRGKYDYNQFPERVKYPFAGVSDHCPSACPLLFSKTAHPDLQQWLQSWTKNLTLWLCEQGKDIYMLFKQKTQKGCLIQGNGLQGCCADHNKSWLLGDRSVKCSRTIHEGCSSEISFCQLFWLRTNKVCTKIYEGQLKSCGII